MKNRHFPVVSTIANSLLSFILFQVLITGNIKSAHGHIASFVSTDGKSNMNTRAIRRPTISPPLSQRFGNIGDLEYSPEWIKNLVRLPGSGQHHYDQLHEDDPYRIQHETNSYEDANVGRVSSSSTSDTENAGDQDGLGQDEDEKATFTPFISARALSNIPGFFQHLRENLEALQLQQAPAHDSDMGNGDDFTKDDTDLEGLGLTLKSPEEYLKLKQSFSDRLNKIRWQPPASGLINEGHRSNTRSFMERPSSSYLREPFIRRAAVSNYNPAWSYTKLGLGRRR